MHDNCALDAGAAQPTAPSDDALIALAAALDRATRAYAATVDQIDQADGGGPWSDEARARMRSLLSECRVKADDLINARAETRAASAAKRKALLRYWQMDIDCDPRAFRLLISVCADFDQLEAQLGLLGAGSGRTGRSKRARRSAGSGR